MLSKDIRYQKLANGLVNFSIHLQPGEKVLIETIDIPDDMLIALLEAVKNCGGIPFVRRKSAEVVRAQKLLFGESAFQSLSDLLLKEMEEMQAYIAIRGGNNAFAQADIPSEKKTMIDKIMHPVLDHRVKKTKWVILRWPSAGFAQSAKMSTEAFEDFFFEVCTMDYSKMIPGMQALKKRMEMADKVHIVGNGTDLHFSIKNIPAVPCGGEMNIPDGEVFTAPVKNSVNGVLQYNTPTVYQGLHFENIRLRFEEGKIVEAFAGSKTDEVNRILDSDPGARYIGEFSFGFNPYVLTPMCDILFDEKICGSFHFTPGQAYDEADNGNRSQVHWDLVCIQRKEYGGGEIYFDDELIRKDGLFVPTELQLLNPDHLK